MGYYAKRFLKHDSEVLSGPVLWYKYENATSTNKAIYDESGNGNTGAYTGDVTGGIVNNKLLLKPLSYQYVSIPNSPSFYFGGDVYDTPLTFSSKINISEYKVKVFINKGEGGNTSATLNEFRFWNFGSTFRLILFDNINGGYINFSFPSTYVPLNIDTVITCTYSGGQSNTYTCQFYVNGIPVPTTKFLNGMYIKMNITNFPLRIGSAKFNETSVSFSFNGTIDNTMMWNRMLTQEEILNLNNIS